jgi:cytochrome c oxidase cbb3-type subunit 1
MTTDTARDERLDGSTAIVGLVMLTVLILGFTGAANAALMDSSLRRRGHSLLLPLSDLAGSLFWHEGKTTERRFDPKFYEGVVKAGVIATMFWGIAGMLVGVIIALQLTWPNLFYFSDFGWTQLRTAAAAAHVGGDLRVRRQRADRTSFYVVQRTCRARWPAASLAVVRVLGLPAVHRAGGDRLSAGHHPVARNTPSRNGTSICG